MLRYLKAAFSIRPEIPGLGKVPVNWIATACFVILGFGHPAFWLLGLGLEVGFIAMLANNRRFQKYVDRQRSGAAPATFESQRQALIDKLDAAMKSRLETLEKKRDKILKLYADAQLDRLLIENNRDALFALLWLYLKLLLAHCNLKVQDDPANEKSLNAQINQLESELRNRELQSALRESKSATLNILRKRLANLRQRAQSLQEIESDLTRIEAHFDLALDNASMQDRPQVIATNIKLASHLLDDDIFGAAAPTVTSADQDFRERERVRAMD